jgi:hypothetical protein
MRGAYLCPLRGMQYLSNGNADLTTRPDPTSAS